MSNPTVTDRHGTVWTWTGETWRSTDGRERYTEQLRDQRGPCRSTPQVIRTPAELEALDPDAELLGPGINRRTASNARSVARWWGVGEALPAVVVASGERVRACREALEGGTK